MENENLVHSSTKLTKSAGLPDLNQINAFVDSIANSKLFNTGFLVKDPETNKMEVDKASIVACIILGNEMGIAPAASLMLGNRLNRDSYFSVIKGRSLGIDPITSISKIYNISTKNGTIQSLAVDLISKAMLDSGCKLEYIRDYEFTPMFKTMKDGLFVGHLYNICDKHGVIKPTYFVYTPNKTTTEELKEAMNQGQLAITNSGYTFVTSLRVVRKSKDFDNTFHYSIQEAIEAGLHVGYSQTMYDAKKQPLYVDGRSNWNNHPATLLRNRVTSIAGRIAVADILQGTYSHEEAMEIVNVKSEEELVNAEVIEDNN